jgi:DNA polymerase-3 subunit epsilon/ATP-dependent DNA helicase DinG
MEEHIYVALDLEMTGLEVGEDEIIEVGAVKFQGDTVLDTFNSLIKPRHSLPLKITRITGITEEDLSTAPSFEDIAPQLETFIGNYPIVGHSVGRDMDMLEAQGLYIPQTFYDTFDLATLLLPHVSTYKLVTLAEHLGIPYPEAHRAFHDADVCRQVFLQLVEHIKALDIPSLAAINRLMQHTSWSLHDLFSDIQKFKAHQAFTVDTPIQPPTETAPPQEEGPLWGTEEARPDREKPLKPTGYTALLDLEEISAFFAPGGGMSKIFATYEQRPQQVEMAQVVAQSFNESNSLMVEAGTGTGKSMAYLVPAALYALRRGERVVVSTNTLNLQDQLFFKDIPDLQNMLHAWGIHAQTEGNGKTNEAPPFLAALLKGRSNYLCLFRYKKMLHGEEPLEPAEARLMLKAHFWLLSTLSGDGSEMMLTEQERGAWNSINVPLDTCTGRNCPDFHDCFFFKARRRAEAVHIIVVNHALLLADLESQYGVLPSYDHLIIDEAHTLEEVATDQLSFNVDQETLLQFFDTLSQAGGTRSPGGLLSRLQTHFRESSVDPGYLERLTTITSEMHSHIERAHAAVNECFAALVRFLARETDGSGGGQGSDHLYDIRLRITASIRQKQDWGDVEPTWDNLKMSLAPLGEGLGKLESLLVDVQEAGEVLEYEELLLQIQSHRRYATEVRINIDHIISGNEEKICWLTLDRARDTLRMHTAPLDVSEILHAQLFVQKQTNILTSATLSINDSFEFIKRRLGLVNAEELQLDSPFDYEKQTLMYIPNDIPEPNQRGYQQKVEEALIQLCTATGGRTLALFTANSAIKRTRNGIQEALEEQDIIVLGQGVDGSRRNLLERFKEWPRTVLLGTSSFWQGIDVVGDALSVLVIAKLPFSVPSDPIFAARSEQFGEPFREYAVPLSILRFKQGFGRLVRSKEDRGIVVVLDKRLLTKWYGMMFLQSLPSTNVVEGPLKQLPLRTTRFLAKTLKQEQSA